MARSQNQKIKILYLEKMMRKTGENRVITLHEIMEELAKHDICAERKSIYDDFEALRSYGMDVRYKRGRNGGYYLAGQSVPELQETEESQEMPEQQEMPESLMVEGRDSVSENVASEGKWEFESRIVSEDQEDRKTMKLQYMKEKEEEISRYFGELENCKEKGEGMWNCCVTYTSDVQFFGWLTAMGKDVKILKPKKLGQSYREYLKSIVKAYK